MRNTILALAGLLLTTGAVRSQGIAPDDLLGNRLPGRGAARGQAQSGQQRPVLDAAVDEPVALPVAVREVLDVEGVARVGERVQVHDTPARLQLQGLADEVGADESGAIADRLISLHPAPHRLHRVLGLEAKNAAIVLPDAPMDITVEECVKGALAFNGQRCAAIKMILVHDSIADDFIARLAEEFTTAEPGMPWEDVRVTPISSADHAAWLSEMLEEGFAFVRLIRVPGDS